jgi:predicted DNA-binding transcriptional regulator AlpA
MTHRTTKAGRAPEKSTGLAVLGTEPAMPPRWVNDKLISITDIRTLFKLGRTAAYELTHRPGFPDPVPISPRCYRWWASEVDAFAVALRRERVGGARQVKKPRLPDPTTPPRRIAGRVRPARIRKKASS